jgi:hypothetical protein
VQGLCDCIREKIQAILGAVVDAAVHGLFACFLGGGHVRNWGVSELLQGCLGGTVAESFSARQDTMEISYKEQLEVVKLMVL